LGIADRTHKARFAASLRQSKQFKPLVSKVKSLGDAIRAARQAKNLTPGYLAAKMGIAAAIVSAWEENVLRPNAPQTKHLADILRLRHSEFDTSSI